MVVTGRATVAVGLALAVGVLAPTPAEAQATFSDATTAAGLSHTTSLPGDMANRQMFCGGAVGDFNNDGWPDIFLLGGGGAADALYINDGDGTFTDQAASWGVQATHRGHGATAGDFNNDGWEDIYVTSTGDMTEGERPGQHRLYRNNGNGTFTDIALSAGVNWTSDLYLTVTSAAFGDYDLDGDLDLAVSGWDGGDSNRLFQNDGDETFTDVTVSAGVGHPFFGFSPRFVDMDGDRWPELLIAADYETSHYYINNQDGTFTKSTTSGIGLEKNGMGQTVADFNRDGLPDWYVTSIYADTTNQDGNYLYVNQGGHVYTALPEANGARDGGWGWGTDAMDCDHDGHIDLAETNGWMPPEWELENSYLFRNNGDMTFSEVQGPTSGFEHVSQGRSLMLIDHDRDGDMDMVITGWNEPVVLYSNDVTGPDTHWLEIRLDTRGAAGLAPGGYGSRIIATTGAVSQYAWIDGGATYLGRSQLVAHFGLGAATIVDQLTVEWPDGTDTVIDNVAADQIITVTPSGMAGGAPGAASSGPGERMVASYDSGTGRIDVTYTPACDATDHTIYFGSLAAVASYDYSGAECGVGTSGSASFDPGSGDSFFLVVGTAPGSEGSYGLDGAAQERPEDTLTPGCDLPRDLSGTCDP